VFVPTQTYDESLMFEANVAGKATGDVHVSGTTIVSGIETIFDEATDEIVDVTIETTTSDGTELGNDDDKTKTVFEPT
jgi:urease gamma subunit